MIKEQDIVKSNALIEALYHPGSVYQMRLMMAALMQIKASEPLDFRRRLFISANALADMTGSKARNNYEELKKASDDLMHTVVHIDRDPSGNQLAKRIKINLTSSCEYHDNEGCVGLRFTEEIVPYISDLKKRFTKYQAQYVMPMKSSYGIRLYELCLQWLGDEREFDIEQFKVIIGVQNKYSRIDQLKSRVIDPAIKDINTYSDIRVHFGQRKTGRRVTHFQFSIVKSAKMIPSKKLSFDEYISCNSKPGWSMQQARSKLAVEYKKYLDGDAV